MALSAIGLFCLVFGIQEGQAYHWGTIAGPLHVWMLIAVGLLALVAFVHLAATNRGEPLVPLSLFGDRNFSLANLAITTVGFTITSFGFPLMLYAQAVRGMTPTRAALLFVPMAVISGALAPWVGRLTDRMHPRWLAGFGLLCLRGLAVLAERGDDAGCGDLAAVAADRAARGGERLHVGSARAPRRPATCRYQRAGAGAGVYNTTRQIGLGARQRRRSRP